MRPPDQTCTLSPCILESAYCACTVASLEFAGLQSPWQSYCLQDRTDVTLHSIVICFVMSCTGPGLQSSRPAYSPDAFDDHAKKGSKLAQRLLGGGKSVTGKLMPEKKLMFGSHVAGRSNHTWSNGLDNGDFVGASRAAEVQQVQQWSWFLVPWCLSAHTAYWGSRLGDQYYLTF